MIHNTKTEPDKPNQRHRYITTNQTANLKIYSVTSYNLHYKDEKRGILVTNYMHSVILIHDINYLVARRLITKNEKNHTVF